MKLKFYLYGRPPVQKNNLTVYQKRVKGGRSIPFVGHSKDLIEKRKEASYILREQYIDQGYDDPLDFLFCIDLVYFVERKSEADLDNLSAFVLDALQGDKDEKGVITNDKLLRVIHAEKIVKGDEKYHGEPRTEVEITKYEGQGNCGTDGGPVPGDSGCEESGSTVTF